MTFNKLDALPTLHVKGHEAGRSGHIVNIASLGGLVTMPTLSGYATTKFGLVGLTETLQHELEPHGIAVTLVCPGNIRTPSWNISR